MILDALAGRRVGIWGAGIEGIACVDALPPDTPFVLIADDPTDPRTVALSGRTGADIVSAADLGRWPQLDVIVRSAGVSIYRPEIDALHRRGTEVTTLLNLWLAAPTARVVVGVTGTKGKSTTSLLIAALVDAAGREAQVAGNIGRAITDLGHCDVAVVEVSSYQASDVTRSPHIGVLTNLGADHLSWHGGLDSYQRDKLNLFAHAGLETLIVGSLTDEQHDRLTRRFGQRLVVSADRATRRGTVLWRDGEALIDVAATAVEADHMVANLIVAIVAAEMVVGRPLTAAEIGRAVDGFERPPARLEQVETSDGLTWINDALASNPLAAAAGVDAFRSRSLVVIIGGADRGVEPDLLVEALQRHGRVRAVVAISETGRVWRSRLEAVVDNVHVIAADDVSAAVATARSVAVAGDVVLFSPAAPTTSAVGNWETRSELFRTAVTAASSNTD